MCSYIMPVIFHFMLYFGKARCMRMGKPNASFGGAKAPPVVETGAPTGAIAASVITDLPPPEIGDSVERCGARQQLQL